MDGLENVAASGTYRPALCLRLIKILRQYRFSYLRRRQINHDISKFAGSGRIFMFTGGGRSFYVLFRWQNFLCSPTVAEVPMFSVGGRRFYVLLRWQTFQCSQSVAEVFIFSGDGRNLYRVIHKSLRYFRTRLRNNQDRHDRKEHINR